MNRADGRAYDQLRPVKITTDFIKFAEGSCLIECGDTKVLCCASVEERTPPHGPCGEGWVSAEYSMLPRANRERTTPSGCWAARWPLWRITPFLEPASPTALSSLKSWPPPCGDILAGGQKYKSSRFDPLFSKSSW